MAQFLFPEFLKHSLVSPLQHSTWLRLRGDLNSYLRDLKLSEQFSSELVKLVLLNSIGSGKELYQRFVMKEQDAQKMRKRYSQLVANHQQLRKDYQKLIGRIIFRPIVSFIYYLFLLLCVQR